MSSDFDATQRSGASMAAEVDEEARRRFEASWMSGAPKAIEEYLPDESQPSFLATLEELVLIDLEFALKSWTGQQSARDDQATITNDTVAGAPSLETYFERFPQLQRPEIVERLVVEEIALRKRVGAPVDLDSYRSRFPSVPLDDSLLQGGSSTQATLAGRKWQGRGAGPLPRPFAGYELLEEIGVGGMGFVYRARQPGTDRDVAVKVLRGDQLNTLTARERESLIERFRTEARATSRIEHPGIVTMFEVGEADELPYYTMQYVRGQSLADRLRDGPLETRNAAAVMQRAAEAVHAGHEHGVLHRDIKPHNIILDEAGEPHVADFGLAKLVEDNHSATITGTILGTPTYMPPEQAVDSASVTVRSDVYALGATLYEALTGARPFQGDSHLEVLKKVQETPPRPPREINPEIDRDLEVICLKCLEKSPQDRYASAAALADDLDRWQRGEAIAARPATRFERVVRWSRKNPLPASLAATTVVALVCVVALLFRTTSALEKSQLSDARARATVNDFFTIISEDVLLNQPAMQPLRAELLRKALSHYEAIVAVRGSGADGDVAAAHYRIGRITELIESSDAALTSYERAAKIQEELLKADPTNRALRAALGTTLNAKGACLTRLGDFDAAFNELERALQIRQALTADDPTDDEALRLAANTMMNIGLAHKNAWLASGDESSKQHQEARRYLEMSTETRRERLQRPQPAPRKLRRDEAMAWFNLANLDASLSEDQAIGRGVDELDRALSLFSELSSEQPEDLQVRQLLSTCHRLLGELRSFQQDWIAAGEAYAVAEETITALASENPRVPQFRGELARLHLLQARLSLFREPADLDAAEARTKQAEAILRELVQDDPVVDDRAELVKTLRSRAEIEALRGNYAGALAFLREALPHAEQVVAMNPAEPSYQVALEELNAMIPAVESTLNGAPGN